MIENNHRSSSVRCLSSNSFCIRCKASVALAREPTSKPYFTLIPLKRLSVVFAPEVRAAIQHNVTLLWLFPSHLLGRVPREVPNDRVFGNVCAGAVPRL